MTHLFLWKDLVIEKEPDTYAIKAVNMGDRPSAVTSDNSYMNDIIDSVPNKQKAIKGTGEIDGILNSGIKEWTVTGSQKSDYNLIKDHEDIKSLTQIQVDNTVTENVQV